MSFGLCGPQGCGKTTMAKAYAERESWAFVPSTSTPCFKELGLPYVGLTFNQRMQVQRLILKRFDEALWAQQGLWVSDRTPLDMAAYCLAEWGQRCNADQGEELLDYVEACFRVLNNHFSMVILVQPGIPYVDNGLRPAPNRAFEEMHTMLCHGFLRETRCKPWGVMLMRSTTDLGVRVDTMTKFWAQHLVRCATMQEGQKVH